MITIEWISSWASSIIVAVRIGVVIEMILPEGNSKKYIKVVIGIYVVFTIVTPVINKFTGKAIEVSDVLELDKYIEEAQESIEAQNIVQSDNESNIRSMYISGIEDDIRAKIEAKGYIVEKVEIDVANDDSYSINSITVEVQEKEESEEQNNMENKSSLNETEIVEKVEIEEVEIGENTNNNDIAEEGKNDNSNNLSSGDKKKLKEYLSSVYEVIEDNITIN